MFLIKIYTQKKTLPFVRILCPKICLGTFSRRAQWPGAGYFCNVLLFRLNAIFAERSRFIGELFAYDTGKGDANGIPHVPLLLSASPH